MTQNEFDSIQDHLFEVEEVEEVEEDDITHPFDPSKIEITMKAITIDLLKKRLETDEIDLSTNFQRKSGLWKISEKSRLIESLLVRIPLPAFYFDGSDDNQWLVVDGLQRLTTLKEFTIDKTLNLQNLEFLKQYEGCSFDDLPRSMQRRIEETQVTVFIINPGTPPEVKFNIFKRINTGGLILSPQEIRHALNQGQASEFLEELADLKVFKEATTNSVNPDRMLDREFILRFIAFTLTNHEDYAPSLDIFLNNAMRKLNKMSKNELDTLKLKFMKSMENSIAIFGTDAFKKRFYTTDKRKPINKALFETWSVLLAQLSENESEKLINNKEYLKELYVELLKNDVSFDNSISYSTSKKIMVNIRFDTLTNLLREVLK